MYIVYVLASKLLIIIIIHTYTLKQWIPKTQNEPQAHRKHFVAKL